MQEGFLPTGHEVSTSDLALILNGIDLASVRRRKRFKLTKQVSG